MSISLKYPRPTDNITHISENVEAIAEQALSKDAVNIDTKSIETAISGSYVPSEVEALRAMVLTLINNLKNS